MTREEEIQFHQAEIDRLAIEIEDLKAEPSKVYAFENSIAAGIRSRLANQGPIQLRERQKAEHQKRLAVLLASDNNRPASAEGIPKGTMADHPTLSKQASARMEAIRANEELWFQRTIKRAEGRSQINSILLMSVFRRFFAYAQEIINAGMESDWPAAEVRRWVEGMIETNATETFDSKHYEGGLTSALLTKPPFIKSASDFIRASEEWATIQERLRDLAERQTSEVTQSSDVVSPEHSQRAQVEQRFKHSPDSGHVPAGHRAPITRQRKKARRRQRAIREAIKKGLTGKRYCEYLDNQNLKPKDKWVQEGCPDSYLGMYADEDWKRFVSDERHREVVAMRKSTLSK